MATRSSSDTMKTHASSSCECTHPKQQSCRRTAEHMAGWCAKGNSAVLAATRHLDWEHNRELGLVHLYMMCGANMC